MPTFRVFLECSSPTRSPAGLYDTFVAVSDEEQASGEHLRVACRRAGILGYGGPYVVREVRRLDSAAISEQDVSAVLPVHAPDTAAARRSKRLTRLVVEAERRASEGPRLEHMQQQDRPASPGRVSARGGRATVR